MKPADAPNSPPQLAGPTRRQLLGSAAVAGLSWTLGSFNPVAAGRGPTADLQPHLGRIRTLRDLLAEPARVRALGVSDGKLVRQADKKADEYTYAVDVGQLLCYFALIGDMAPYLALRDYAERELVVDIKDDPFTRGFVLWRTQPGAAPDASGTTEALRIAKGLWMGAGNFNRPQDRALSMTIVDGYGRHQNVDQGLWLIRNYFHFYSRAFASNSYIIDYDPDFVRDVADFAAADASNTKHAAELNELAAHSRDVLRNSVAPCGLLYDLLQPELKTMYYGLEVAYFSPNDIIQLNNACATAATVVHSAPEVAAGVLGFVADRLCPDGPGATTRPAGEQPGRLYAHYIGRTGRVHPKRQGIGATEYCAVVRLAAVQPGDTGRYVIGRCVEEGMIYWDYAVNNADTIDAWTASELLLGMQSILDLKPT